MSYHNRISLYTIIGNFAGNTGINNVNDMLDDLARWAAEAEMHIGSRHSYERHECEIEVENYVACLPKNFLYLNALKFGSQILEVTKKDFRLFNRGGNTYFGGSQPTVSLNSGNLVLENPGCVQVNNVYFRNVFNEGEVITLTIVVNNCGNIQNNVFTYNVLAGDNVNTIALAFYNLINAVTNLPYTVTYSSDFIQLTGCNANISFQINCFTNSLSGQLEVTLVQARRAPTKQRSTTEQCDAGYIRTQSPNLANRSAVSLNDGNTRAGVYGAGNFGNRMFYGSDNFSSKYCIENGKIYFNTIENGRVGISYMGIMIDENGWPMVSETHADAISAYLIYMWTKRRFIMGKISGQVYSAMKNEWEWKCGQTRGEDELPDAKELEYLANQHMQLLPLPNKNYF